MDRIRRVRNALAGMPVDRPPVSFWYHFPQGQQHGSATVAAHLAYSRDAGIDFLKIMNEHPYETNVDIHTPSDWRRVRPAPLSALFYQQQLDEVKRIVGGLQGEALAIVTIFGPFASGNHASGNQVTEHLKADPEAVSHGLGAIADSLAEFGLACVEAGAAGIYYSAQGGEEDRFTEAEFVQYIKPHDLNVLGKLMARGEFHLLHVCRDRVRLWMFADYPSHAVNWAATKHNPNLAEGRMLFKRTVVGGMDDRGVIAYGTEAEIRAAVRALIEDVGTEGFMIGADCTIPTGTPVGNVRAAVEAAAR
ncbi:MAG: hypothetical protein GX601_15135 [Anaerolineales bacterium]|nr:hypothetical protein [Anaerolineales bacterium]